MIARCRAAGETPDPQFLADVDGDFDDCERRIQQETDVDEFEWLSYQARVIGQLRAYVCPLTEIYDEGASLVDLTQDWGFSEASVKRLRDILDQNCRPPFADPQSSRGSLRSIMHDVDVSEEYLEEFEGDVRRLSWILLGNLCGMLVGGSLALAFSSRYPILLFGGLLMTGVSGSCASVLARMPIAEVSSSAVSASLERTILIRVGTGLIASVVGSALAWGVLPIEMNKVSFADVVTACSASGGEQCTSIDTLILLAVPVMFGFSERVLTTLEGRLFGGSDTKSK